jgi:spoIIIJ-associated protein
MSTEMSDSDEPTPSDVVEPKTATDQADGPADNPSAADEPGDSPHPPEGSPPPSDLLEREGDIAADYLEVLLDIADLDGDIDIDVEGERAAVSIVGAGLGALVGPGGATLDALQELTRLAVLRETGVRSRLMLDVGGHRSRRRDQLAELGRATAARVLETAAPEQLTAMTPFERKVVHDAVAAVAGVRSESEGQEPDRYVVILPA